MLGSGLWGKGYHERNQTNQKSCEVICLNCVIWSLCQLVGGCCWCWGNNTQKEGSERASSRHVVHSCCLHAGCRTTCEGTRHQVAGRQCQECRTHYCLRDGVFSGEGLKKPHCSFNTCHIIFLKRCVEQQGEPPLGSHWKSQSSEQVLMPWAAGQGLPKWHALLTCLPCNPTDWRNPQPHTWGWSLPFLTCLSPIKPYLM